MALLEAHTGAAAISNASGWLPIHCATLQREGRVPVLIGVVAALLAAYPAGVTVRVRVFLGDDCPPNLAAYPAHALLAALKAAAASRRKRAPLLWHMWRRQ